MRSRNRFEAGARPTKAIFGPDREQGGNANLVVRRDAAIGDTTGRPPPDAVLEATRRHLVSVTNAWGGLGNLQGLL